MDQKRRLSFLYWGVISIIGILFLFFAAKLFPVYKAIFSFLWKLFAPFLVACLIAYILHPIVKKMEQINLPKSIAILLIYVLFFGGIACLIYAVYPIAVMQLRDLNEQLPQLINMYRESVYELYERTAFLPETVHDKMDQLIHKLESYMDSMLTKLVGLFTKVFDMLVFLTVIPVLVFYYLKDYETIKSWIRRWMSEKYKWQTAQIVRAIDESLGSYFRGLLIVSSFVSLATWIVFHLLNINYALLLAIIMGLTNIIPYFGPIIGAIPAILITATVSRKLVIFVIIAVFAIQLIESNLISPYVVGRSVRIHPIAIIFALLLGGEVGGAIGMILAVPVLTVCKVIVVHILAFRHVD
ncbi:MAG TPA: AI-2E family transporter [Bacillota bacterium]|nr:AI-2E family transporter [Bacillota bacterium]